MGFTVAIVGRPNVGKSTLFNRLIKKKMAIIEDTPGVTRDRLYGEVTYKDKSFNIIDTGGIDDENTPINDLIKIQASVAIDESDLVVLVVDGKYELNNNDYILRDMLKKSQKQVIVAVNKLDNYNQESKLYDYYSLGFDDLIAISSEHNNNISVLLDKIYNLLPSKTMSKKESEVIKFSIIGRPNVGKSSLLNAILNEERVLVSDVAGTTRDSINTSFMYNKKEYLAVDTAGIRKSGRIYESIEKYSVLRALKAIDSCDVCLLVINSAEGVIEHDKHIASEALSKGKAIIIVINKWDIGGKEKSISEYTKYIKNEFQFLPYAPIVFLSALTKKRIHTLMPQIDIVYENAHKEIKTSVLNEVIRDAFVLNAPPSYKGKRLKIYFAHQADVAPPKFIISVNSKKLIHFSYHRYLENKIRESIDFTGTPIVLEYKNKNE